MLKNLEKMYHYNHNNHHKIIKLQQPLQLHLLDNHNNNNNNHINHHINNNLNNKMIHIQIDQVDIDKIYSQQHNKHNNQMLNQLHHHQFINQVVVVMYSKQINHHHQHINQ